MSLLIRNLSISTKSTQEEGNARPELEVYLTSLTSKKYSNFGREYLSYYLELSD